MLKDIELSDSEKVIIQNPSYIESINDILVQTGDEIIETYLKVSAMSSLLKHMHEEARNKQ